MQLISKNLSKSNLKWLVTDSCWLKWNKVCLFPTNATLQFLTWHWNIICLTPQSYCMWFSCTEFSKVPTSFLYPLQRAVIIVRACMHACMWNLFFLDSPCLCEIQGECVSMQMSCGWWMDIRNPGRHPIRLHA